MNAFNYWELLAGIALFLFAMSQLESVLKSLGGRSLAVYLRNQTGKRINAVIGGIVSTTLLQSSSVVGLMVLAFTGAGLLNLTSALGIIFGSNLGTTATGWIVATIGFKLEIFKFSLPLTAIGGAFYSFTRGRSAEYGRAILSLGLLMLGLQMMKSSVGEIENLIDINTLANLSPWQYLLAGTSIAIVIQSSSATMMITLAALYGGIISLPNAAVVAIGADLGTTTTVLLGAIRGSAIKRQVAAGHVLFNVVIVIFAFFLRMPLLSLIFFIGIEDPLYAVVAFHSLFNLIGLFIFVPLTTPFAHLLQRWLPEPAHHEISYLDDITSGVIDASVDAVERETSLLIARAVQLNMTVFTTPIIRPSGQSPVTHQRGIKQARTQSFSELYNDTKTLEGMLVEFTIKLQADQLEDQQSIRLSSCLNAAREAMHSAKAVKDIQHNLQEFSQDADRTTQQYANRFRALMDTFIQDLYALRPSNSETMSFEELSNAMQKVFSRHESIHDEIYADVRKDLIAETRLSSLLNVNRELLTASRSLLLALANYYLDQTHAQDLDRITLTH
ncbi:MAG: Na/Pi symporter [Gammaproteobacteria bacterium]|nr:Na/Pi symporter [Gammaproteobacteria bacterium]